MGKRNKHNQSLKGRFMAIPNYIWDSAAKIVMQQVELYFLRYLEDMMALIMDVYLLVFVKQLKK